MVPVTFHFLLPARLQWLEPAGGKRKSADIERKMYTLIYPDPSFYQYENRPRPSTEYFFKFRTFFYLKILIETPEAINLG
jgi:hypothetical protein